MEKITLNSDSIVLNMQDNAHTTIVLFPKSDHTFIPEQKEIEKLQKSLNTLYPGKVEFLYVALPMPGVITINKKEKKCWLKKLFQFWKV